MSQRPTSLTMHKMPKRWWGWVCQEGCVNQLGIISKYTYHFQNLISHVQVENYKPSRACVITEATIPHMQGRKKRQRTPFQKVLVSQACPTLCDPIDCSPQNSPGKKNTGVGCHSLLQGIFPTQGSNPHLLHCRQILYCPSHHESPLFKKQPLHIQIVSP